MYLSLFPLPLLLGPVRLDAPRVKARLPLNDDAGGAGGDADATLLVMDMTWLSCVELAALKYVRGLCLPVARFVLHLLANLSGNVPFVRSGADATLLVLDITCVAPSGNTSETFFLTVPRLRPNAIGADGAVTAAVSVSVEPTASTTGGFFGCGLAFGES